MRLVDCFIKVFGYTASLVSGDLEPPPDYETVSREIHDLISTAENEAARAGFPLEDIDQAKFAVCAFVDESILLSQWPDVETWAGSPLQREYYFTANAGEEFFERLPSLSRSAREVYVTGLALGFKGRYFHPSQQPELEKINQTNLEMLLGRGVFKTDLSRRRMFPWAYSGDGKGVRMWRRFSWVTAFFLLVPPAVLVLMYSFYYLFLNWMIYDFYY